jgi:hypothetical protein
LRQCKSTLLFWLVPFSNYREICFELS